LLGDALTPQAVKSWQKKAIGESPLAAGSPHLPQHPRPMPCSSPSNDHIEAVRAGGDEMHSSLLLKSDSDRSSEGYSFPVDNLSRSLFLSLSQSIFLSFLSSSIYPEAI